MGNNTNSAPSLIPSAEELQNAVMPMQFIDEHTWYQVQNGIIRQGGICSGGMRVNFPAPFPKQVLLLLGPTAVSPSYDLNGFTPTGSDVERTFFWLAEGI